MHIVQWCIFKEFINDYKVDTGCRSSLDYWFAVLDTDDDGFLCLGELHPFYKDSLEVLLSCGVGNLQVNQINKYP